MTTRPRALPFLAALLALAAAVPARAQTTGEPEPVAPPEADETAASAARDAEARHLFEAGRNAYDDGRYADALDYFQRGYELSRRPQLLYNVGQAADRLRRDEIALEAFKSYLEKLPDAENRPQIEERIRVLEEVLAQRRAAAAVAAPVAAPAAEDPVGATAPVDPPARDANDDELLNQWWFWAGAGGVVVAIVVVAVVAGSSGGGTEGELTNGSNGVTVAVLSLP